MTTLKGSSKNLPLKRRLRKNLTEPERRLWFKIRNNQLGIRYRRQHGIGSYIVDFYSPHLKLVIEIDGESHGDKDQLRKDSDREKFLHNLGITTIRFYNSEVMRNVEGVLESIYSTQQDLFASTTPSNSPLQKGRERRSFLTRGER